MSLRDTTSYHFRLEVFIVSDYFNETHNQVRMTTRKFITTHVLPHIDEWEEAGEFPREIFKKAGDAGILAAGFPEALGGMGEGDVFLKVAISEELMRSTSGGFVASLGSLDIGLPPVGQVGKKRDSRTDRAVGTEW